MNERLCYNSQFKDYHVKKSPQTFDWVTGTKNVEAKFGAPKLNVQFFISSLKSGIQGYLNTCSYGSSVVNLQ